MVRGLKKKLLIGLLSAAVVGTSLSPSVPLVGSFAQEVKAAGVTAPEPIYKYTKVIVTPEVTEYGWDGGSGGDIAIENGVDVYTVTTSPTKGNVGYEFKEVTEKKVEDFDKYYVKVGAEYKKASGEFDNSKEYFTKGDSTIKAIGTAFKWPDDIPDEYFNDDKGTPGTKLRDDGPNNGTPVEVYTREVDTTKSKVTVAPSTDTKSKVTPKSIGSTGSATATIDKNQATQITVDVVASDASKTIKSVIAKVISAATNRQIGSDITATKVDGTDDTYKLVITATEETVKVLISTEEDDLLITPKLSSTLSSKVGTAELTSTSAVKPGTNIELKVTLAEGATKDNVTVKANNEVVTGSLANGVVTYSIGTKDVTDEELEIEVSGRLDNDGLEKAKTDKGSKAAVANTGDVAADANDVLSAAKAGQDGKYVNAKVQIDSKDTTTTDELADEVDLAVKSGLKLAGYISVDFFRTVSDNPILDGAADPTTKVTKLDAPLAVKYFLPKAAIGKTGYKAIRFHDTIGEITTTPNADGEYIEVKGNELILHVKLLSDFAVVYNDTDATPDVPDPDPVPKPDPDPTPVKPDPTPVKPNPVKPSSDTGTKAAKVTTSTKKSTKTSSPKTADYAVNSLLALLTGAAGLFGITLINKKRKEDEE